MVWLYRTGYVVFLRQFVYVNMYACWRNSHFHIAELTLRVLTGLIGNPEIYPQELDNLKLQETVVELCQNAIITNVAYYALWQYELFVAKTLRQYMLHARKTVISATAI